MTLEKDSPELFSNINSEQFLLDIKNSENFELLNYTTSPQRQEESLIEFIGNKWVLHAGTNIQTSNHDFELKKSKYQEEKWIKIPSNNNEIGINQYESFTFKEIITRTLILINNIVKNYKTNWDNVS